MTYKDLRIELHKNYYCEKALSDIGSDIISKLGCTGDYTVNSPMSQIELHLNTPAPSELNLNGVITSALIDFISKCGIMIDGGTMNLYNTLISHVEGDTSTVIIML